MRWRRDGKELFFLGFDGRVEGVSVRLSQRPEFGVARPLFTIGAEARGAGASRCSGFDVSLDGSRFVIAKALRSPLDCMALHHRIGRHYFRTALCRESMRAAFSNRYQEPSVDATSRMPRPNSQLSPGSKQPVDTATCRDYCANHGCVSCQAPPIVADKWAYRKLPLDRVFTAYRPDVRRLRSLSVEVKPVLFPVRCPALVERLHLLHRHDPEPAERGFIARNRHIWLRGRPLVSTLPAANDWSADVPLGANLMKHCVEFASQADDLLE